MENGDSGNGCIGAWLAEIALRWSWKFYIAVITPIRFIAFYSLPDGISFLVRLTMVVVVQVNIRRLMQHATLGSLSVLALRPVSRPRMAPV